MENNTAILDARVPGWREKSDLEIIGQLCAALEGPVLLEGWLRERPGERTLNGGVDYLRTGGDVGICIIDSRPPRAENMSAAPTLEAAMLDAVRRARGEGR